MAEAVERPVLLDLEDVAVGPIDRSDPLLSGITLQVCKGEFTVLLGPNGAGKSTLLRAMAGLIPIRSGRIAPEGGFDPSRTGLLLEHPPSQLLARTVRGEIELALESHLLEPVAIQAARTRLMARLGLGALEHRDPRTLSAGEQQRVLVASVLAHTPDVLLLDDPFAFLDPRSTDELLGHVRTMVREGEVKAALLATHDVELAVSADWVGVLAEGGLWAWGRPDQVLRKTLPPGVPPPLVAQLESRLEWTGGGSLELAAAAARIRSGEMGV